MPCGTHAFSLVVSNNKMTEQEIIITKIESNKLNVFGKREGKKLVKNQLSTL